MSEIVTLAKQAWDQIEPIKELIAAAAAVIAWVANKTVRAWFSRIAQTLTERGRSFCRRCRATIFHIQFRTAVRVGYPKALVNLASEIHRWDVEAQKNGATGALAQALAYFHEVERGELLDRGQAMLGLCLRGAVDEAYTLERKGSTSGTLGPARVVTWLRTDPSADNYFKRSRYTVLVTPIAEALLAEHPGLSWPPEFCDVDKYFREQARGESPKNTCIDEIERKRLSSLRILASGLRDRAHMVTALSKLSILCAIVLAESNR